GPHTFDRASKTPLRSPLGGSFIIPMELSSFNEGENGEWRVQGRGVRPVGSGKGEAGRPETDLIRSRSWEISHLRCRSHLSRLASPLAAPRSVLPTPHS